MESVILAPDSALYISDHGYTSWVQWECYPECLFVILTQFHCVSVSRILSQINFEDADCSVKHTLCQVLMACCVLWVENQTKKSTEQEKENMKWDTLTLRSTSALQTAKKRSETGERQKERGRDKRGDERGEKKRLKLDYHRVQQLSTLQANIWDKTTDIFWRSDLISQAVLLCISPQFHSLAFGNTYSTEYL